MNTLDKKTIDEKIGKRVCIYRKKLNLTQEQLAEKLKVSVNFITLLENGRTGVKLENLIKLSNILNITPNDLLQDFIESYKPKKYQDYIINVVSKMNNKDKNIVKKMAELLVEEEQEEYKLKKER